VKIFFVGADDGKIALKSSKETYRITCGGGIIGMPGRVI